MYYHNINFLRKNISTQKKTKKKKKKNTIIENALKLFSQKVFIIQQFQI